MADIPVLQHSTYGGVSRIKDLPDALLDQEPATLAQLNAAVDPFSSWKDNVRASTQADITLSGPGATVDGVTMAVNDRMLVRAQTLPEENGIYLWNGAAVAATRTVDFDTFDDAESAICTVDEGTDAGVSYRQTQVNGTLDTNDIVFVQFGTAAPDASTTTKGIIEIADQSETDTGTDATRAVTPSTLTNWSGTLKRYQVDFGDGASSTFNIDHNLGTLDVQVQVFRKSDGVQVTCDILRSTTNRVILNFSANVASSALRALVNY